MAATAAAVLAIFVATSVLGVAAAEAPTATPVRTVAVQGLGSAPIEQHASAAQADGAYREAMAAALADAKSKAEFLAGKAGAGLGAVQGISEDGGYVQCTGSGEPDEIEYQGEQPDFGYGGSVVGVPAPAGVAAPAAPAPRTVIKRPSLHVRRVKRPTAKRAAAASCQVKASVAAAYALS